MHQIVTGEIDTSIIVIIPVIIASSLIQTFVIIAFSPIHFRWFSVIFFATLSRFKSEFCISCSDNSP